MFPTVSAREVQRQYRTIVNKVQQADEPMIVIARNKPELAIMSLETLRRWSNRTAAHSEAGSPKALLGLAGLITKGLPADLSIRHNDSIFADLTIEGGQVAA